MISIKGLDYIKQFAETQADMISGGVLYIIGEGNTITWRKASKIFDLDLFQVGDPIAEKSIARRSMAQKATLVEKIPKSMYGIRLSTIAEPLVDDQGEVVGMLSILFPRVHPIAQAFKGFAPILSEMFAEGAVIYTTDLHGITNIQSSNKFSVPSLNVGNKIEEDSIAHKVLKTKKPDLEEPDVAKYGVPVMVTCYPLLDEDDQNEAVGTFGIIIPKAAAANLRHMSKNLQESLSGISAAIQQLAASAALIHSNEQELNKGINKVTGLSQEIKEISVFIKEIADETKMLGLNAAIEAARAGEAGKGFGVVADEIRKLSDESKGTVPKINKLTDNIRFEIEESGRKSERSLTASQEQAAATEEITASIEEISAMAEELNRIAEKL